MRRRYKRNPLPESLSTPLADTKWGEALGDFVAPDPQKTSALKHGAKIAAVWGLSSYVFMGARQKRTILMAVGFGFLAGYMLMAGIKASERGGFDKGVLV